MILIRSLRDGAALRAESFDRTNAVLVDGEGVLAMLREDGSLARYPLGEPKAGAPRLADREVRDGTRGVLLGHRGATYEVLVEQAVEVAVTKLLPHPYGGSMQSAVAKVWTRSWQERRRERLRERRDALARAAADPRPGLFRSVRDGLAGLLRRGGEA